MLTLQQTAQELLSFEDVLILCHRNPDGDTLGSGYALCRAYLEHGVRARVFCSDEVPEKFHYLSDGIPQTEFTPRHILSVDVADPGLLGEKALNLVASLHPVELSIDHHPTHRQFADEIYVEANSASCCEIIRVLLEEMGWEVTPSIASCLYTGIATDTGCFKYSNVTAKTHMIVSQLYEYNIGAPEINRIMFDTKSRKLLELERMVLDASEFHFGGKCILLPVTAEMQEKTGCSGTELEGIAVISRSVEGVIAGITVKQTDDAEFKVSLRTYPPLDASAICRKLGGGGHKGAAGASVNGTLDEVKAAVLKAVEETMEECNAGADINR